jgi:hypothetical protein
MITEPVTGKLTEKPKLRAQPTEIEGEHMTTA